MYRLCLFSVNEEFTIYIGEDNGCFRVAHSLFSNLYV